MIRFKDNTITRDRLQDRFNTGRLYAHLRHEEMKQAVSEIHKKEKGETSTLKRKQEATGEEGIVLD